MIQGKRSHESDFDEDLWVHEMKLLKEDEETISKAISDREEKDMDRESLEFLVDMLNLIFGNGEETDYFWDNMLLPECIKYFEIQQAMEYTNCQDSLDDIICRKTMNLNSLFYAVKYLFGFKLDPPINNVANGHEINKGS